MAQWSLRIRPSELEQRFLFLMRAAQEGFAYLEGAHQPLKARSVSGDLLLL